MAFMQQGNKASGFAECSADTDNYFNNLWKMAGLVYWQFVEETLAEIWGALGLVSFSHICSSRQWPCFSCAFRTSVNPFGWTAATLLLLKRLLPPFVFPQPLQNASHLPPVPRRPCFRLVPESIELALVRLDMLSSTITFQMNPTSLLFSRRRSSTFLSSPFSHSSTSARTRSGSCLALFVIIRLLREPRHRMPCLAVNLLPNPFEHLNPRVETIYL